MAAIASGVRIIRTLKVTRWAAALVILALAGVVGFGYNSYRANLDLFEKLNKENLSWTSAQLKLEHLLFSNALHSIQSSSNRATPAMVNRRFDILWSRVQLSKQGSVGERLRSYDTDNVLEQLFATMQNYEAEIVGLRTDDLAEINRLIAAFDIHLPRLRAFNTAVFHGEQRAIAEVRRNLRTSAFYTAVSTFAAFIIGTITIVLVSIESRRNMAMAERNLHLAETAEKANLSKSRFLTMMSHELRTPMNGVLGMLALTKTSGVAPPQMRLIEQAERSGKQMISMLGDILDYSALQEERMVFETKPFDPRHLADAVEELFGSVARREGIRFHVVVDTSCPPFVAGDTKRLRQIVAHFASFIVETAGTKNVDIRLSHANDQLEVEIGFDYGNIASGEVAWKPDILLGLQSGDGDSFASDALGPAVARGILEKMGGTVRLGTPNADHISILMTAPAPEVVVNTPTIYIEAQSESLRTICRLGFAGTDFRFADESTPDSQVHVVLFETGMYRSASDIDHVKLRFPNALFLALGDPINPSDFDGILSVPLDIGLLRSSVEQKLVG